MYIYNTIFPKMIKFPCVHKLLSCQLFFVLKLLCAFYIFETSLKMPVFDNKIREHAATYMTLQLLLCTVCFNVVKRGFKL